MKYALAPISHPSVLPGITIEAGTLIIDAGKLLYPGDILHEAGHLATASPEVREGMTGTCLIAIYISLAK